MKIYLISTLHHDFNLDFNPKLAVAFEKKGITIHLPQRDTDQEAAKEDLVQQNIEAIKNSDACIVVLANASRNLGAEVGFSFGLGHPTIGLAQKGSEIDWMVEGMLTEVIEVDDLLNIESYIDKLMSELKSK